MIMPWLASASHGPPPSPTLIPPQELPSTHGLLPTMTQSSTITTPTATAYDSRNKITCPWHRQRLWPTNTSNSNHKQQQLLLPRHPPSIQPAISTVPMGNCPSRDQPLAGRRATRPPAPGWSPPGDQFQWARHSQALRVGGPRFFQPWPKKSPLAATAADLAYVGSADGTRPSFGA